MVMTHQDDGGDLSIIASNSGLLFACSKGHYWRVPTNAEDAFVEADQAYAAPEAMRDLVEEFGDGVMGALGN